MIAMCCVITQIQDVLSITKLDHMFGIFPDETSALASFH
jgi:hypothetical protein